MRKLFVRFYFGVLAVLFLAWLIHGYVLKSRTDSDRTRVIAKAHGGGARMMAIELNNFSTLEREQALLELRKKFKYPVTLVSTDDLPPSSQRQLAHDGDVLTIRDDSNRDFVFAALCNGQQAVKLGPYPDYSGIAIEDSLGGWILLTAAKIGEASDRNAACASVQKQFDFPVALALKTDLPSQPQKRLDDGRDVVFYSPGNDLWFAATPLSGGEQIVRFGPFPSFERIEQKAAATTLALVLLPAALAIALLLRPVSSQLRHVENAAKRIAAGDLSARVDERRVGAAQPMAQAFNNMAERTEKLVGTQRELLQAVSHELRTPLSRIQFAIDLITTSKDDGERKKRLESLESAAEDLDELVDELLQYVKLEAVEPELKREQVIFQESLAAIIPKYASLYPGVDFNMNNATAQPDINFWADRLGFQRVFGNLLSNAGRHARSAVLISVKVDDKCIVVDVDDDGAGIPESDRERVLEPFVRLDNQVAGDSKGSGLGLALAKRIVLRHGGRIALKTSPMGGCKVRTIWPLTQVT